MSENESGEKFVPVKETEKPEIEKSPEEIEAEKIKVAIRKEEQRLEKNFSQIPKKEYKIYTELFIDKIGDTLEKYKSTLEKKQKGESLDPDEIYYTTPEFIEGFYRGAYLNYKLKEMDGFSRERIPFEHEVESVCRHALATTADTIVFFDRSARGHGLLTHKILPVIRLEYAKSFNIDPNTISLPKIVFINPAPPHESIPTSWQKLLRNQSKILLFEESSMSPSFFSDDFSSKTYEYYQSNKYWNEYREKLKRIPTPWRNTPSSETILKSFINKMPDKQFDLHIADTWGRRGAGDEVARKHEFRERLWGVAGEHGCFTERYREKPVEDKNYKETVEREEFDEYMLRRGFKTIEEARKQLRQEFDMMAKESFERLILGEKEKGITVEEDMLKKGCKTSEEWREQLRQEFDMMVENS